MSEPNQRDASSIGCLFLILIVIFSDKIIAVLGMVFNLLLLVGIGAGIYFLEKKTGWISSFFNAHKHNEDADIELNQNSEGVYGLPDKKGGTLLLSEKIDDVNNKLISLKEENKELRLQNQDIIKNTIEQYSDFIDKKNKKELMEDIFGDGVTEYSRSDEYERQKLEKQRQSREEDLTNREWRFEMDKTVHDFRIEALQDRLAIRYEMKEGFSYLEKEHSNLRQLCVEKWYELNAQLETRFAHLKTMIGDLRVELKQELGDFKVQVGKEFVRMDKAILGTISKLEQYHSRVEKFSYEVKKATVAAERNAVRGERMLNQAQVLYAHHKADIKVLSKDIDKSLHTIALRDREFSNKVAGAKLMLDRSAMEQVDCLKQIAHEKMGVNLLRDSHHQQIKLSTMKMEKLVSEKKHIEEKMSIHRNNERKMSKLQHQLYVNEENLAYARNRNSIMQQEFSLFKRLSR